VLHAQRSAPACIFLCNIEGLGVSKRSTRLVSLAELPYVSHGFGRTVRRFMLYDTLLHELGHLRMVTLNPASGRRAFSRETRAEKFAEYWRKRLWSEPVDHPDPVHHPPSPEEFDEELS